MRDDEGKTVVTSLMRSGAEIDAFVTDLIAERLRRPDALRKEASTGPGAASSGIDAAISEQRARILRAQRDYDDQVIEGRDLQRVRGAAEARIQELEGRKLVQGRGSTLAPILGAADPASVFRGASLNVRRQVVDALATVTLLPQPRGSKGFDHDSVVVEWKV